MSFIENLKARIKADGLFRKLVSTMKEPPGKWWVDTVLIQELLHMTDFEHKKFRDLQLYVRPMEGEVMEVLVFDNELAIYHTTVADVGLRKSPFWQEMISIRNIKKIMNHHDVLVSTGKASIERIHANAIARLDLTYTRDDLALLLEDARRGLERKAMEEVQESLDLFVDLLAFEPMVLDVLERDLQVFAGPEHKGGSVPRFENLLLFDRETLSLGLKKGPFSPEEDVDLAWVIQYARGEKTADLKGMDVFNFLAELALEKAQKGKGDTEGQMTHS
ncbi:MAG: hypothetical protein K9N21_12185 [Deltaproteobacteria bacterium]|nr:hypothetical protein [Deltaproteobacteria bacterium]